MKTVIRLCALLLVAPPLLHSTAHAAPSDPPSLWDLARRQAGTHRFSTLFSAQDVRDRLANEAGIAAAMDWCRRTAVTKVYVESFRDGYQADEATLTNVMARFRAAGFEVSGCITPTQVGKPSTGWQGIACYTDKPTQDRLKAIAEFAARLNDETMVDDFWFTDCACAECDAARKARTVTVGDQTFPVSGDTWTDYRCELMVQMSRHFMLAAGKKVNPNARFIIKYPQWYDRFHERGYEVVRQTADFDRIWVGTETRDYNDRRWGGTVQYEGYFLMRWLGGLGGEKCGGGWYDSFGTSPATYVEQARQTVLAGARESLLFSYGSLQRGNGPANLEALRTNITELWRVADAVRRREPLGLAAYKPPNSPPGKEAYVFDFVGLLGLPLVPCHRFPSEAPAAFFSVHALKDTNFIQSLAVFISQGKPVLLTDGLAEQLTNRVNLAVPNVRRLPVKGDPKSLLQLSQAELDALRTLFLDRWGARLRAPRGVALYLFKDGSWVLENFNDQPAEIEFKERKLTLPARGWRYRWE